MITFVTRVHYGLFLILERLVVWNIDQNSVFGVLDTSKPFWRHWVNESTSPDKIGQGEIWWWLNKVGEWGQLVIEFIRWCRLGNNSDRAFLKNSEAFIYFTEQMVDFDFGRNRGPTALLIMYCTGLAHCMVLKWPSTGRYIDPLSYHLRHLMFR